MTNWLKPIELSGSKVKLIPLNTNHKDALLQAAQDGNLWDLWYTSVPSAKTIDQHISTALRDQELEKALPFVVLEKESGKIIGSTRYCNAEPEHRRLEIGYTWYAKSFQRTGVNTECKYLLLTHAFETLESIAVEFRTHWHNLTSRKAIARLGAKQDAVLRNHRINPDRSYRDTVVFSIIESEWKTVKMSLEFEMRKY